MRLYSDIQTMLQDAPLTSANMYECITRYWDAQPEATQGNIDTAFHVIDIIGYLADHDTISKFASDLRLHGMAKAKKATLNYIVAVFWKVWRFSKTPSAMVGLRNVQVAWRRSMSAVMGPRTLNTNDTDPFSMEPIASLPATDVFSFEDPNSGLVYAFDVKALRNAVYKFNQRVNPLTKLRYPQEMLQRLEKWHKAHQEISHEPRTEWSSSKQAFTDLASVLEEVCGLYLQPAWLMHFDEDDVMHIFNIFHRAVGLGSQYMDRNAEARAYVTRDVVQSHFALVTESIKLIKAGDDGQVCCLIVAIAQYSPQFGRGLPEWVYDGANVI
jgi:hypothetical protein